MPLTTTSRFTTLWLNFTIGGGLSELSYRTTDGTSDRIQFEEGYPAAGTDELTALETLQTIHASADGFLDADGDEFVIAVGNVSPLIQSIADLEPHGLPNVFIAGSWQGWIAFHKMGGAWLQDGEYEEDADTEQKTLTLKGNIKVGSRTPDETTFAFALGNRWTATQLSAQKFWLTLRLNVWEEITAAGLDSFSPAIAVATWMDNNRTSGSSVGSDYDAIGTWDSRTFRVRQATGQNNMHYIVTDVDIDVIDGNVTRLNLKCERNPPSAVLDIPSLRTHLMGLSVNIPTTTDIEEGSLGAEDQPMIASKVQIGPDHTLEIENGLLVVSGADAGGQGVSRPLLGFYTASRLYSQLDANAAGYKVLPVRTGYSVFHFDGTANGSIQMPSPPDAVEHDGLEVLYEFHNITTDYNCVIRDFNGDAQFTLYPGDYASFRIGLRLNGTGGEMVGVSLEKRKLRMQYQVVGPSNYIYFTSFPFYQFQTTHRWYIISPNPSSIEFHNDVFRVRTNAPPVGDQGSLDADSDFAHRGVIEILKNGDLSFETGINIYSGTATGLIGSGWGLRVEKVNADNTERSTFGHNREEAFSGDGARREVETFRFNGVDAGDRLLPCLRFKFSDTTYSFSNLGLSDQYIEADFTQRIQVDWSA